MCFFSDNNSAATLCCSQLFADGLGGYLISNAGQYRNGLKIRPPLVFEKQHAEQLLTVLPETLEEAYG